MEDLMSQKNEISLGIIQNTSLQKNQAAAEQILQLWRRVVWRGVYFSRFSLWLSIYWDGSYQPTNLQKILRYQVRKVYRIACYGPSLLLFFRSVSRWFLIKLFWPIYLELLTGFCWQILFCHIFFNTALICEFSEVLAAVVQEGCQRCHQGRM